MITFLFRHYLLHQEKQREIKKKQFSHVKEHLSRLGVAGQKKKKTENSCGWLRLVTSLPDSCVTRQRGHRNGSEERKALTCEKGEAVVVLVGWGFGVACFPILLRFWPGRATQAAMAVFCLAGSSGLCLCLPPSQDYWKWKPTRLMSRLSWAVGRPSPTTITIYSHSLTHPPATGSPPSMPRLTSMTINQGGEHR